MLNYPIRMDGDFAEDSLILLGARIDEGINRLTKIDLEFAQADGTLEIEDFVGTDIRVTLEAPNAKRVYPGTLVAIEYLGSDSGREHYYAELRPWFWFLSRTADSRVYQEISVPDLFKQVLGEYGFSSDLDTRLSGSYPVREFILQYRESDLDFLTRIAEEEGVYFYFVEKDGRDCMVLADDAGAHETIEGDPEIPFRPRENTERLQLEHFFEWRGGRGAPSGRITLGEYNFEKPSADMKVASALPKGKHAFKDYEVYDYPGKYWDTAEGDRYAKFRMEAEAIAHHVVKGTGPVPRLRAGHKFTLKDHPRKAENKEYLALRVVHQLKLFDYDGAMLSGMDLTGIEKGMSNVARVEAVPAMEQYRALAVTPKPVVHGVQTATVVGPGGEIHTDQYGRVKIKFHWDREGKSDGKDSCWVRVMTPWAGKNWGMIHVPRMGQEVVVDFEEGDPDRPIIVGMLYNASNMPPYPLDASKTVAGIKTNSSEGGGGYNELAFEDKKGAEYVRLQAERDFHQIVKNDATVHVGFEHASRGDLTRMIKRNTTEITGEVRTHMTGLLEDLTVGMVYDEAVGLSKSQLIGVYKEEKVGIGKQDFKTPSGFAGLSVAVGGPASTLYKGGKYADLGAAATAIASLAGALRQPGKKEEIHGVSELEVLGDRVQTVKKSSYGGPAKPGNHKTTIEDGYMDLRIKKGNSNARLDKGDWVVKLDEGSVTIEAEKSITLMVGDSKLVINQAGIRMVHNPSIVDLTNSHISLSQNMTGIDIKDAKNIAIEAFDVKVKGETTKVTGNLKLDVDGKLLNVNGQLTKVAGKLVQIN